MNKVEVKITSATLTDKGLSEKRPVNEDSFLEMPTRRLYAVADGVGGAQAGDFASQTAMEVLEEAFAHPRPDLDSEELMEMAIQRANESIFQMSRELPQLDMMATTIVALQIEGNIATIGHVGDSRLYRLDSRFNLFRETNDHSVVEEEVRAGRMTPAQAANHPSRNVISRALGAEATVDVELRTIMFEPNTTFLLCSDGITRHLADHELRDILTNAPTLEEACREFKDVCFKRGAEDNLTAVVVNVQDAATPANPDFDDEKTLAGARTPAFAPNPLPTLSNGGAAEARSAEFAVLQPVVSPNAATAPLEEPEEIRRAETIPAPETAPVTAAPNTILKPASQTFGVVETAAPTAEPTLQAKIDNDRLREKINDAAPLSTYADAPAGGGLGKILLPLVLLLVGIIIGAGGFYLWNELNKTPAPPAPPPAQTQSPQLPAGNTDLPAAELNEFRTFERVRRATDGNPTAALAAAPADSAADFYLRGRALLQTGKYPEARDALVEAEKKLDSSEGVTRETLRVDIALAQAAVGAMTLTAADRRLLTDVVKTKQENAAPNNSDLPASIR